MVSAGSHHTVLLRSDGSAVAIGKNEFGQCDIPSLAQGLKYIQFSAGIHHTVLLQNDGRAVAIGKNTDGRCDIPPLDEGASAE
jgi:alpha-tubulin suppressor-like RCC1 family protein